jgi:hypothetical protein
MRFLSRLILVFIVLAGAFVLAGAVAATVQIVDGWLSTKGCSSGELRLLERGCTGVLMPLLAVGAIGMLALYAHTRSARALDVPSVGLLAWPGLFLGWGWVVMVHGMRPPDAGGLNHAYLLAAAVLALMGGAPLLAIVAGAAVSMFGGEELTRFQEPRRFDEDSVISGPLPSRPVRLQPVPPGPPTAPGVPKAQPRPAGAGNALVAELERLSELKRTGELSETEFRAAKQALLSLHSEGQRS